MRDDQPLLDVRGISKTFPGLKALDSVSLQVHSGEIVALVGHNGSGKSTLVKILAGVHQPDPGGEIRMRPGDGGPGAGGDLRARLHFIHQDLGLIGMLTAVENLGLGAEGGPMGLRPVRSRAERRHAEEALARFGAHCDVSVPVAQLTAAERAIIAIARALDGWTDDHNVLVLDEPTEALHRSEVHQLFEAVRTVARRGAGVIFISHHLDEVLELADRVVVLRDGHVIADQPRCELDAESLVRLIAGIDPVDDQAEKGPDRFGPPVLAAQGLHGGTVRDLSLQVCAGEVVGVSGVLGSGREHVAGLLFGAIPGGAGEVDVAGRRLPGLSPRTAIRAGMAYVPADRRRDGGVMTMTARENVTLPRLAPLRRLTRNLDLRAERREVGDLLASLDVRPCEPERALELFSGGNQQKVVLAKWLRTAPSVLLLDEPTQGVDVGAKAGIYQLIARTAAQGTAVLICSSDAAELARLCDRVLVLRDGAVVAELAWPHITEERLLRRALDAEPGPDAPTSDQRESSHHA